MSQIDNSTKYRCPMASTATQYRVTVEQYIDGAGWMTVVRQTQPKSYLEFISLSGLAKLLNKTRAQLRYQLGL